MWVFRGKTIDSYDHILEIWSKLNKSKCNTIIQPFGFVYKLTDEHGRKYIGKKQFKFRRKLKPLKGRKRKRIKTFQSDWLSYMGSSDLVNKAIEQGIKFHKEILVIVPNKRLLGYYELKYIFSESALESEEYYNKSITNRYHSLNDFGIDKNHIYQ